MFLLVGSTVFPKENLSHTNDTADLTSLDLTSKRVRLYFHICLGTDRCDPMTCNVFGQQCQGISVGVVNADSQYDCAVNVLDKIT